MTDVTHLYKTLGWPALEKHPPKLVGYFTGDIGASATFNLMPSLVSKTSVGAQYNRRERGITTAIGTNLPPGSSTVAGAATVSNTEATIQSVVAGGYVEQQFALNDRIFVTGAMRAKPVQAAVLTLP